MITDLEQKGFNPNTNLLNWFILNRLTVEHEHIWILCINVIEEHLLVFEV